MFLSKRLVARSHSSPSLLATLLRKPSVFLMPFAPLIHVQLFQTFLIAWPQSTTNEKWLERNIQTINSVPNAPSSVIGLSPQTSLSRWFNWNYFALSSSHGFSSYLSPASNQPDARASSFNDNANAAGHVTQPFRVRILIALPVLLTSIV